MSPRSRTIHLVRVVAAAVTVSLAAAASAAASTWTVRGNGISTVGGFDFADVQVQLADPSGSAGATTAGGIPLTITHTATLFSVSGSFTIFDGECLTSGSFAGGAPVQVSGGSATASGTLTGSGTEDCGDGAVPFTITGAFFAQSADAGSVAPVVATVATVSGTVTLKTPFETQAITPGTPLAAGALVQTGGDGNVTFDVQGGVRVSAAPNTQVTLLPPSGSEAVVNQIAGQLSHSRAGGSAVGSFRVQTATATVRPTGTEFTTRYSQSGTLGTSVISVQSGMVEVEDRRGQRSTLVAGQEGSFEDAVPRVLLILPVDGGTVREGTINAFSWTAFPGAAGYLFEYTLKPSGFAAQNSAAVEDPRLAFLLFPPAITQTDQTVEFRLPMPVGLAPKGTRGYWRIFPVDGAGRILVGTTASDGAVETIQ